jgi:hypothetical protein
MNESQLYTASTNLTSVVLSKRTLYKYYILINSIYIIIKLAKLIHSIRIQAAFVIAFMGGDSD